MALIIEGSSRCAICNEILDGTRKYIGTPALTSNMLDDLFLVNDCGVHVDCLEGHPVKEKLNYHLQLFAKAFTDRPPICVVDRQPIINSADFFFSGLLTSEPAEPLFKFNYLILNRRNIPHWGQREEFIAELERFREMGKWKSFNDYPVLEELLKIMKQV